MGDSDKPIFTIKNNTTGNVIAIYTDGQVTGLDFTPGSYCIDNRIPSALAAANARSCSDKKCPNRVITEENFKDEIGKPDKCVVINADQELQEYTCNAKIQARPMKRGEYNLYRGWEIPADENPDDYGFLCLREDGSESWVPKELFLSTHVERGKVDSKEDKNLKNFSVNVAQAFAKDADDLLHQAEKILSWMRS
jgi:hypothetical protein